MANKHWTQDKSPAGLRKYQESVRMRALNKRRKSKQLVLKLDQGDDNGIGNEETVEERIADPIFQEGYLAAKINSAIDSLCATGALGGITPDRFVELLSATRRRNGKSL